MVVAQIFNLPGFPRRLSAGGIMLPNHAPLAGAEQFGVPEALFSGAGKTLDLVVNRAQTV
jgi:hypothetical protein